MCAGRQLLTQTRNEGILNDHSQLELAGETKVSPVYY